MTDSINRRTFTKTVLAGLGATAMPDLPAAAAVPAQAQPGNTARQLKHRVHRTRLECGSAHARESRDRCQGHVRARLQGLRNLWRGHRRVGQEGHARQAHRSAPDSADLRLLHAGCHRSGGAKDRDRDRHPLGQDCEEARRQLHGGRGQGRKTRGLRLCRASREHRRRAQRLRQGPGGHRPRLGSPSAHEHADRDARRGVRDHGEGRHEASSSSRPTSASCRRGARTRRRW